MDKQDQGLWLIRDLSNVIRGPYNHQEVLGLLRKKQLKNKTEISRSNSYWFAVEEKTELGRFFPELGIAVPEGERQTQMTATLTEATSEGEREDITQFVSVAAKKNPSGEDPPASAEAEWLSPEMAEEFGVMDDFSIEAAGESHGEGRIPSVVSPGDHTADEMLSRATVKADTLPSEMKDFQGGRPKPITSIIRAPERMGGGGQNVVQVPVQRSESPANILSEEGELDASDRRRRWIIAGVLAASAMALGASGYFWAARKPAGGGKGAVAISKVGGEARPDVALRHSLLLYDLEGAKESLARLEESPSTRGKPALFVADAVLKREFLFDSENAVAALQSARGAEPDGRLANEIDNLTAIYSLDKDQEGAIETFRQLVKRDAAENIFKYNLAYALIRANRPAEALPVISGLVSSLREEDPLFPEAAFLLGWGQELDPKMREAAEGSFLKAIAADPHLARARLGLAIHRLRRNGFRAAEGDFRVFTDSAPDLDPPSRIIEFRKIGGPDFYYSARIWLRELNLDGPRGSKPAALVMAVDAILSCLQNRTGEAGKILEGALALSNGDVDVIKAMGYHRWKEGRYAEVVELFRDVPKEKMGFAVPFIMGKALLKLDRRPQAKKMFEFIIFNSPARSEGWAQLGDLLLQEGKKAEAEPKLLNAVRKDPYNLVALRALDHLGQPGVFSEEILGNLPF